MWQRFTERARRLVFFAQEEAGRLGENYVSTEHLLLGLVREDDSVAARILERLGISLGSIRREVELQVRQGDGRLGVDMQLAPRAKRVCDLAYDEARQLNNNYIGTEHILLGLIREGEGMAGRILKELGADLDRTRQEVILAQEEALARNQATSNGAITWQHFSERARHVILRAQEETRQLGEIDICPEHLLIALTYAENCLGHHLLTRMDLSPEDLRSAIKKQPSEGLRSMGTELQLASQTKWILQLALVEAQRLKNRYIGTEHLLLALICVEGKVGSLFKEQQINLERVRTELEQLQYLLPDQHAPSSSASEEKGTDPTNPVKPLHRSYRYSEYARRTMQFAVESVGRPAIGALTPEYILLGTLHYENSASSLILQHLGITQDRVRSEIEQRIKPGSDSVDERLQLINRTLRALDLAKQSVIDLQSDTFGTEHFLLGVVEEGGLLQQFFMIREQTERQSTRQYYSTGIKIQAQFPLLK